MKKKQSIRLFAGSGLYRGCCKLLRAADSSVYNPFGVTAEAGTTGVGGSGKLAVHGYSGRPRGIRLFALQLQPRHLGRELQRDSAVDDPAGDSGYFSLGEQFVPASAWARPSTRTSCRAPATARPGSYTLNGQTFTAATGGHVEPGTSARSRLTRILSIAGGIFSILTPDISRGTGRRVGRVLHRQRAREPDPHRRHGKPGDWTRPWPGSSRRCSTTRTRRLSGPC